MSSTQRIIRAAVGSQRVAHRCLTLGLAMAIDRFCGEAPVALHPVVWMGQLISAEERFLPRQGKYRQLAAGAMLVSANMLLAGVSGVATMHILHRLPRQLRLIGEGVLLSTLFSIQMLRSEAHRCTQYVVQNDLSRAREALRALVSRDTAQLDSPTILAAVTESVAENTCDSVVAPLLAYILTGLPGAVLYRMANTMDAMLGYRGHYEYLGKAAARLDDLLNWLPARLTAGLFLVTAPLIGMSSRRAWQIGWRDHRLTASPNAGWPMSVAAGALGARLEKRSHYVLGRELPAASPATVAGMITLLDATTALLTGLIAIAGLISRICASRL
jgi:adenosylcobinamide-phosphate synthase